MVKVSNEEPHASELESSSAHVQTASAALPGRSGEGDGELHAGRTYLNTPASCFLLQYKLVSLHTPSLQWLKVSNEEPHPRGGPLTEGPPPRPKQES